MKKYIWYIICILFLIGCNSSDISEEYENETWNEELWQTLLHDSTFIELGGLLNNKTFFLQVINFTNTLPPTEIYKAVEKLQNNRIDKVSKSTSILKKKYPLYSPIYFRALYNLSNNTLSRAYDTRYELEEIEVLGDCSYAVATYASIVASINNIKKKYYAAYPNEASSFWQRLVYGSLLRYPVFPPSERAGLKIIAENFYRIKNNCEETHELALKLKKCNTYMTKIRDLLSEAVLSFDRDHELNFYPPQKPTYPSTPEGPRAYTKSEKDKLAINKPNLKMETQLPNCCVISILEVIGNELCGGGPRQGDLILDYYKTYRRWIPKDGVRIDHLNSLIEKYFKINPYQDVFKSIDSKNVVVMTIPSKIKNSRHFVLVIGYTQDGRYIYLDPEIGSLRDAPQAYFYKDLAFSISSCK